MKIHKDDDDYRHGFCFVVPFGKWKEGGGDLYFPDLGITVVMKPGMVVAFKSAELLHGVTPYVGERYSIVLFSGQTLFFSPRDG